SSTFLDRMRVPDTSDSSFCCASSTPLPRRRRARIRSPDNSVNCPHLLSSKSARLLYSDVHSDLASEYLDSGSPCLAKADRLLVNESRIALARFSTSCIWASTFCWDEAFA